MRLSPAWLFLAVSSLMAQDPAGWQGWMNRGVEAYKNARYPEAIEAFQKAADLNPANVTAHLYLATACMSRYMPGSASSGNLEYARRAESEFQRALELDPNNSTALVSLGHLTYSEAQDIPDQEGKSLKLGEARDWFQRAAAVAPGNRDVYYTLGVIAWAQWYPNYRAARTRLGMKPEDPGPMPHPLVREELKSRYGPVIEDGIANLEKTLQLDPQYGDAMAYMNLLVRERADLRDTAEEYARDIAIAERWLQAALAAKQQKVTATPVPQRIRVDAAAQERKLIQRVEPVYPPLARQVGVEGTVRFTVVIGKDGRMADITVIGGHPLLIPAALEAVKQWVYKPTEWNGIPVEVVTEVALDFVLRY